MSVSIAESASSLALRRYDELVTRIVRYVEIRPSPATAALNGAPIAQGTEFPSHVLYNVCLVHCQFSRRVLHVMLTTDPLGISGMLA